MNADLLAKILTKRTPILLLLSLFCLAIYLPGITHLPPFDRDEARFVQATKQMLETGNFIDIRFQDKPRHKKPVGIYWLQAASVSLFADGDVKALWAYRLPSLLAAMFGVLLVFLFGDKIFGRRTGALAALLLASSIVLTAEAHLAKTDAALLFCTVLAQGSLGVIYLRQEKKIRLYSMLFWLGLATGILIKGPILPAISGLTIAALLLMDHDRSWLKQLNFLLGIPLLLLIVLPWLTAIYFVTEGAFYKASLGGDLLSKMAKGQESHGAYPGYYILFAMVTFFPASLFMFQSFFAALKDIKVPAIRFCLAWIIPSWLLFEIVPTKLVHYVLPLYPALALLIADRLLRIDSTRFFARKWAIVPYLLWGLIGIVLAGIVIYGPLFLGNGIHPASLFGALAALAVVALGYFYLAGRSRVKSAVATALSIAVFYGITYQNIIPQLDKLWLSSRIADTVHAIQGDIDKERPVIITGFTEPSAVFLLTTETKFGSGAAAAHYLLEAEPHGSRKIAVVEKDDLTAFEKVFIEENTPLPRPAGEISGLNYSKGHWKEFTIYAFPE